MSLPKDPEQLVRQEFFSSNVSIEMMGIELGPSYRPTFPKTDGWKVLSLDHCETSELIRKYEADPNVPDWMIERIEPVDLVWNGGSYLDVQGMPEELDFVVACHLLEHVPDLIGFLQDVSRILKPDGQLLLALPRRDLCFDFFRPLSTLGDIALAHTNPNAYEIKAELDETYFAAHLNGLHAWSNNELKENLLNHNIAPSMVNDENNIVKHLRRLTSDSSSTQEYRDGHRWVFEPAQFADLMSKLRQSALIDFQVDAIQPGWGCEFLVRLSKKDGGADLTSSTRWAGYGDTVWRRGIQSESVPCSADVRSVIPATEVLLQSTSWRITAPLRYLGNIKRRML